MPGRAAEKGLVCIYYLMYPDVALLLPDLEGIPRETASKKTVEYRAVSWRA